MSRNLACANIDFCLCDGLGVNHQCDWEVILSIWDKESCSLEEKKYDLTGLTGYGTVKAKAGDDAPIANIKVEIQRENQIVLSMSKEETSKIPVDGDKWFKVSRYQYDVILEGDGKRMRVLEGIIEVSPSVTDNNDKENA